MPTRAARSWAPARQRTPQRLHLHQQQILLLVPRGLVRAPVQVLAETSSSFSTRCFESLSCLLSCLLDEDGLHAVAF
eukprot:1164728-Pyramimonas_sp.AAC.1